jgi:hypothetical protein
VTWSAADSKAWRASIPFTDEQIAAAIETAGIETGNEHLQARYQGSADFVRRTGRLTRWILGVALHRLVVRCEFCDKTALYRVGSAGRCSAHKGITSAYKAAARARWEARSEMVGQERKASDQRDLAQRSVRASRKFGSNPAGPSQR